MNEIEEKFYKCFGIEPKLLDCNKCGASRVALGLCAEVKCKREYPPITDRVLLSLEEIILNTGLMLLLKSLNKNKFEYIVYAKYKEIGFCERETRQDALLQLAINIQNGCTSNGQEINYKRDIFNQVRTLFEDGEEC